MWFTRRKRRGRWRTYIAGFLYGLQTAMEHLCGRALCARKDTCTARKAMENLERAIQKKLDENDGM
jgi:hypothetical protein